MADTGGDAVSGLIHDPTMLSDRHVRPVLFEPTARHNKTVVKPALIAARTSTQVMSTRSASRAILGERPTGLTSNAPIKPKQATLTPA